jgi:hypothetical protein
MAEVSTRSAGGTPCVSWRYLHFEMHKLIIDGNSDVRLSEPIFSSDRSIPDGTTSHRFKNGHYFALGINVPFPVIACRIPAGKRPALDVSSPSAFWRVILNRRMCKIGLADKASTGPYRFKARRTPEGISTVRLSVDIAQGEACDVVMASMSVQHKADCEFPSGRGFHERSE